MNTIAERAGTTIRSISRYFGTKENLIVQAMEQLLQNAHIDLKEKFDEMLKLDLSGFEQVIQTMQIRLDYSKEFFGTALSISEMEFYFARNNISSNLFTSYIKNEGKLYKLIHAALIKGIQDGSIRKDIDIEKTMYFQRYVFKGILQKVAVANASIKMKDVIEPSEEAINFINLVANNIRS